VIIVSSALILIVVVIIIFFSFFLQREHFLIALLLLELISIALVLGIPLISFRLGVVSTPFFLILLTMRACEARIGLAVIVYLVRSFGGDILQSIRLSRL
jgi:NADH-ubiquinone oxidoreductase chain 4L